MSQQKRRKTEKEDAGRIDSAIWTPTVSPKLPPGSVTLPVILGSSSVARQDERSLTVPNQKQPRECSDPVLLTQVIALAKAKEILNKLPADTPESLLITADAMAHFNGIIREKPNSEKELRIWWAQYQKQPVKACTTVVVTNTKTKQQFQGHAHCQQLYKPMPDWILDRLIQEKTVLDCAGGYIVDAPVVWPYIGPRVGSQSCLMGFPLEVCLELLQEANRAAWAKQPASASQSADQGHSHKTDQLVSTDSRASNIHTKPDQGIQSETKPCDEQTNGVVEKQSNASNAGEA
eukprot:gb/GEZN01006796.1/.p1 GENE.gb/GEZN01006796.1/~~gb/GEZN01006796.1/.p1  ORF type:complete len:291 (+),score=50.89 gb/GEZN01006796.1/:49-921(+)